MIWSEAQETKQWKLLTTLLDSSLLFLHSPSLTLLCPGSSQFTIQPKPILQLPLGLICRLSLERVKANLTNLVIVLVTLLNPQAEGPVKFVQAT